LTGDGTKRLHRVVLSAHIAMSNRNINSRYYTGVSLEPEVIAYLDDLAGRMRMNRSWVLNTIVHEYAQVIEARQLNPLRSRAAINHI
jgi:hypothetical protein